MNIGFVGGIRYFDINKVIIKAFENSPDFILSYIGKQHPGCYLEEYCTSNKIKNVKFYPTFVNSDKPRIYQTIDIINSVYGSNTLEVSSALPNKLYDCILYKKPIIVSKDTFLNEVVDNYNLGVAVDVETENIKEKLQEYLSQFNEATFLSGCAQYLDVVRNEKNECLKKINKFLKSFI